MNSELKILEALAKFKEDAKEDLEAAKELYSEGSICHEHLHIAEDRYHKAIEVMSLAIKALGE